MTIFINCYNCFIKLYAYKNFISYEFKKYQRNALNQCHKTHSFWSVIISLV
ncbi:hypothetical protein BTH160X_60099 [Brochothrix thermosphacta]|nr:hypothetical protein BTH160X_60099 [Brochothrix thermosphacta]